MAVQTVSGTALTQTTFDVTTKADAARIVFTNSTGVTQVVKGARITASPVTRNGSWVQDSFINADDIRRNGHQPLTIGNQYVCTKAQTENVADYRWKRDGLPKWVYPVTEVGPLYHYEPGDWATMVISGTQESVTTSVEVKRVLIEGHADKRSTTKIWLREVITGYTHDANARARLVT